MVFIAGVRCLPRSMTYLLAPPPNSFLQGNLTRPKEKAINKVGHALHELDDRFRKFSLENQDLKQLARELGYHKDPRVLQSMVICKQPQIGGSSTR